MNKLMIALTAFLAFASAAHAEDFTMTRGYDGKVFYCTDRQGSPVLPAASVTMCDCAFGSANYGEVVATSENLASLRAACQASYSSAVIQNCHTVAAPQGTVTCDCVFGSANYGQVLAGVGQLGELAKSCHQSYSSAVLKNCKAQ